MRAAIATVLCLVVGTALAARGSKPYTLPVNIRNVEAYVPMGRANESALYAFNQSNDGTAYEYAPLLVKLKGTRFQIGYDYAALLGAQTAYTYTTFLKNLTNNSASTMESVGVFDDFLWDRFYSRHVPAEYFTELRGMEAWCHDHKATCDSYGIAPHTVAKRFYGLANMPADAPNLISGLVHEFDHDWPSWLKALVEDVIKALDGFIHTCDAYGVWGSRTEAGRLYTSRNLDYNSNTGINRYKLMQIYDIDDGAAAPRKKYATFGFTFGLGALAGQSDRGITTSEMNLDNTEVTYSGLPFPLRLRYILENAHDLQSAMTLWNATNNTNSFNFLIGSAADGQAYALETMRNFTGVFPANSPIEAAATFDCGYYPWYQWTCLKWVTNQSVGKVPIGFPLPEAVWRTNHGMNPVIMKTQEPLFNNTIFRYNTMHDLFKGYGDAGVAIADEDAVRIVATLGIKGDDYFTCDQKFKGDNVLSVAYVPGEKRAFVAWEEGHGFAWRPAACNTYYHVNLSAWWA